MQTSPVSVLVIEAHPLMREALCTAIANEAGWLIAGQAVNSHEALQMIKTIRPAIILFALENHPRDDLRGVMALRQALPGALILALTSNETTGQEQAALKHGAHAALTKAAPRTELIQTLRELQTHGIIQSSKSSTPRGPTQK